MNLKLNIMQNICEKYGYMDYYVLDENIMLDDYNLSYENIEKVQLDVEDYFDCKFKESFNRFTTLQEIIRDIEK